MHCDRGRRQWQDRAHPDAHGGAFAVDRDTTQEEEDGGEGRFDRLCTPQDPWIMDGTVRENVLLGCEYNSIKYASVIRSCADWAWTWT
jgi:ABC-type multidrug transport system fused ATPase/permease subunit